MMDDNGNPDSPHPRGWTADIRPGALDAEGFPAPAGMDPRSRPWPPPAPRIPRTRGDGPRGDDDEKRLAEDSPHPRGWTLE